MNDPRPAVARVIEDVVGDPNLRWIFWCPGCRTHHYCGQSWTWDGNREAPTVSPSILVQYNGSDAGIDGAPPARCHLFIRSGQIEFLGDCTHEFAGKTVRMEPLP